MAKKKIKTDPNYKPKGEKRSMILYYNDIRNAIDNLTNEQLGELMRDVFLLEVDNVCVTDFSDGVVKVLYTTITFSILENKQKYRHRCAVNNEISKRRTNRHDNDNENETESVNDNKEVDESDKAKSYMHSLCLPPSLNEICTYVSENNIDIDPEDFYNYYEANGWMTSRGQPVVNWKNLCHLWKNRKHIFE